MQSFTKSLKTFLARGLLWRNLAIVLWLVLIFLLVTWVLCCVVFLVLVCGWILFCLGIRRCRVLADRLGCMVVVRFERLMW